MTDARTHTRTARQRDKRMIRTSNARAALAGLTHDAELYIPSVLHHSIPHRPSALAQGLSQLGHRG